MHFRMNSVLFNRMVQYVQLPVLVIHISFLKGSFEYMMYSIKEKRAERDPLRSTWDHVECVTNVYTELNIVRTNLSCADTNREIFMYLSYFFYCEFILVISQKNGSELKKTKDRET